MIINGDNLSPSVGNNITIPDGLGFQIGNTQIASFNTNGIFINQPYWNIVDQKAANTSGGTFTAAAWQTRVLNTTIGNNTIIGSSLLNNQFTLPTGTYRISVKAPAFDVNRHKAKLRNITDSADTLIGTSEYSDATGNVQASSIINGIFTIISSKVFEIQHYCATTVSTNGFGVESNFGVVEIYTIVELWKIG